jgi:hypothetical protein
MERSDVAITVLWATKKEIAGLRSMTVVCELIGDFQRDSI